MIFLEIWWFLIWRTVFFFLFIILGLLFKIKREKEKHESYECGFNTFWKNKRRFCIRFFNVAVLFLLVDLEIVLFLPFFLNNFKFFNVFLTIKFIIIFLFFLILLLYVEYKIGGLSWKSEL